METSENAEDDEESYVEVVEYIRAAVQLIHDELEDVRSGDAPVGEAADMDDSDDPDDLDMMH